MLSSAPTSMEAALGSIVSMLEPMWFELAIFMATFLLSCTMKYIASKKKKLRAAEEKQKLFTIPVTSGSKVLAGPRSDVCSKSGEAPRSPMRQQQQQLSSVSQSISSPIYMMEAICGASQRGSSARAVSQALDLFDAMRLKGYDKDLLQLEQQSKYNALDFYNSLLCCSVRMGKPELVSSLVRNMQATDVSRTRAFYEGTMKMLAGRKYFQQALAMYDCMVQDGFEPSPATCSCMINFALEVGDLDRAIASFEKLSQMERPSIRAYMTILRVYSKRQDWSRSVEILKDMQIRGSDLDNLVLNIVLATCVHADRLDQAQKLLGEMLSSTTRNGQSIVDVVSYNTLIKGCARNGELSKARGLLEQMTNSGVKPNQITFNTVMDSAMRCKQPGEAWRVLRSMQAAGFVPDKYSCSILVKGLYAGSATKVQIRDGLELICNMGPAQMDKSLKIDPALLETLFHSLLDASVGLHDAKLAQDVLEQMKLQKVMPKPGTGSAIVKCLSWRDRQ